MRRLGRVLSQGCPPANPVDVCVAAPAERYGAALGAVLDDPQSDAVLALNVPTAVAGSAATADQVATVVSDRHARTPRKPVFAAFIGAEVEAAAALRAGGISPLSYRRRSRARFDAAGALSRGLDTLIATPPSLPDAFAPDASRAREIVLRALEINPLLADDTGVIALDARVTLAPLEPKFKGRRIRGGRSGPIRANGNAASRWLTDQDFRSATSP